MATANNNAMVDLDHVREVLDLKKLDLPPKPRVVELRVEPYVDHVGEDSLWIWVVLDSRTRRQDMTPARLNRIDDAISRRLLEAGIHEFPYTHTRTRAQLAKELRSR